MEMIMWEASPPSGLRYGLVSLLHPEPMSTSSRSPWPLSSRTARHRRPSAVRVNVTPVPPLTTLWPPSSSATTPAPPVLWVDVVPLPDPPLWRMAAETSEPVVVVPPAEVPVVAPVAGPVAGADDSGAVAVCGVALALDGWTVDV
jgi:hypothetical protein